MGKREKPRHVPSVKVDVVDTFDRIDRGLRVAILAVESEGMGACARDGEALAMHLIDVFGDVARIRKVIEDYIRSTERR